MLCFYKVSVCLTFFQGFGLGDLLAAQGGIAFQGGAEGFSASLRMFSVLTYLLPWRLAVQTQVPTWLLLFYCLGPVSKQCQAAWAGLCEEATPTEISQAAPACCALTQQQQGYCSRLGARWLFYAASSLPYFNHLNSVRAEELGGRRGESLCPKEAHERIFLEVHSEMSE